MTYISRSILKITFKQSHILNKTDSFFRFCVLLSAFCLTYIDIQFLKKPEREENSDLEQINDYELDDYALSPQELDEVMEGKLFVM